MTHIPQNYMVMSVYASDIPTFLGMFPNMFFIVFPIFWKVVQEFFNSRAMVSPQQRPH